MALWQIAQRKLEKQIERDRWMDRQIADGWIDLTKQFLVLKTHDSMTEKKMIL